MIVKLFAEIVCDGGKILGEDYDANACEIEIRVDARVGMNNVSGERAAVAMGRAAGYARGLGWTDRPDGAGEDILCPACTAMREEQ